jgi:hypothetical protein
MLYYVGFAAVLVLAVAIAAYNLSGAFGLGTIPPGSLSPLSYIGMRDLQRGQLTSEALKSQSMLAYIYQKAGLSDFDSLKLAAITFFSAIPLAGGLFTRLATKSMLVGAISSLLLSVLPLGYISAVGGDYSLVAAVSLTLAALSPALLFLRGGRTSWLVLSSAFAVLAGMSAASGALMLFLTCGCWGLFTVLSMKRQERVLVLVPGVVGLATCLVVPRAGTEETLRQLSLASSLPGYLSLLALLGIAGFAGAVALSAKEKRDSIPMLALLVSGVALIPLFWEEALLLVSLAAVLLVGQPLTELRRMVAVTREGTPAGGGSSVVEFDLARIVAVAVSILMLISPIVLGFGPGSALQGTNYLGVEELSTLNEVQSLSPSVFGQGLVAAPSSIAPWLRAETGANTILPLNANQSAEEDAITTTSFRLRSSYLMVDDWTPLSFVRSPIISAFDGETYAAVLHVDDGQNRVNFTYGKQALSEGMAGMYMSGHSFGQNSQNMSLTLQLSKVSFNVTKGLTVAKSSPTLTISYVITPDQGSDLLSMTLPVFIEGQQQIKSTWSGDTIHLTMTSSNVSLSFSGGSKPELAQSGTQAYVESTYNSTGGMIRASLTVDVESAKDSRQGDLYASLLDDMARDRISSLLTFTPPPGLNFLSNNLVQPSPSVDVKDSFNQVLLTSGGVNYIESPSYATVLSQNVTDSCDATFSYKTAGLVIVKKLSESGDALSLSYQVTPWKANTILDDMNVTLWIPFDRSLIGYVSNSTSVNLTLDSGSVGISATSGHLLGTEVGPDPTYGQDRVLLRFSLNPSGDTVGVQMKFGGELSCQQGLSSRPLMNGGDELVLSMNYGLFVPTFSNSTFTVYRVAQANFNEAP